jgi:hypothetical protein
MNRITIEFPKSRHFCLQKYNWRGTIFTILLALSLIFALPNQPVQAASLTAVAPKLHAEKKHVSIKNLDEALMYINAQNLVDTWNNILLKRFKTYLNSATSPFNDEIAEGILYKSMTN